MGDAIGSGVSEPEAIAGRLQTLRDQFASGLLKAHDDLAAELAALISADPAARAEAITRTDRIAHRLAGSAGVFGFAKVSMAAHELQSRCLNDGSTSVEIVRAVNALRAEIMRLEEPTISNGVT